MKVASFPTWRPVPVEVHDVAFILDSWCNDENVYAGRHTSMDPQVFKVGQRERIMRLLGSCPAAVVRPEGNSTGILGWAVYSMDRRTLLPIIHFMYVKATHRRQGIATALLSAAGVREKGGWATTERRRLVETADRFGLMFNPYLLDYDPTAPRK